LGWARRNAKPVIVATQVLESMIQNAGEKLNRTSDEMEGAIETMHETSSKVGAMASTISAIVQAQQNLKKIRL